MTASPCFNHPMLKPKHGQPTLESLGSRTNAALRRLAAVSQLRRSTALVVTLLMTGLLIGTSNASARVPKGFIGMVVGPPLIPAAVSASTFNQQLDKMVASGVESLRFAVYWSDMQPYRSWRDVPALVRSEFQSDGVDTVPTRFGALDAVVGAAAQRQLGVVPTVLGAPTWAGRVNHFGPIRIPTRNTDYARFMKALVLRYGSHGDFWTRQQHRNPITMWTVWNEPNERSFWPIQPFAKSYVAMLRIASAAIRGADHHAKVILAGFPNYSWTYVDQIYQVPQAQQAFDVVGLHPYTSSPDGVITIIGRVRQVMDSHHDRGTPIVADELGWPSSVGQADKLYGFETTEAGQARNVAAVLPLLARNRARLRLLGFDYYTWAGVEKPHAYTFDFSGLLKIASGQFVPKPAFRAFARTALALEGCRVKRSVANRCAR
jgi:hypothetical protein